MGWYWILWAGLVIVLTTIEIATVTLYLAMIAGGCFAAFIVSLTPAHWWWQVIVAAVVSLALIFTVRRPLLRALRRGSDETKSNVDALIGQSGRVLHAITPTSGQVKLSNGETWSARLSGAPSVPPASSPAEATSTEATSTEAKNTEATAAKDSTGTATTASTGAPGAASAAPIPVDSWVSVVAVEGATVLITPTTGPALSTP